MQASCISDNGCIVGFAEDSKTERHAFLLVPTIIDVEIDITPKTLNLKDKSNWISCHILLPPNIQNMLEPGEVTLRITGELMNGNKFVGTDTIRVLEKAYSSTSKGKP